MPSTAIAIAIVCALAAQAAPAPTVPTGPGAADQPCASLPQLPLRRTDPRVWEVKFEASVWAPGSRTGFTAPIKLRDAAVVFPLLQDGA